MGRREIRDLEDSLAAAAGLAPSDTGEDKFHFHDEIYPGLVRSYAKAKADVAQLGFTELVETTIRDCLTLLQQGQRKQAEDLLLATSSTLSEKSGTWDDMRRMYTASNDSSIK